MCIRDREQIEIDPERKMEVFRNETEETDMLTDSFEDSYPE